MSHDLDSDALLSRHVVSLAHEYIDAFRVVILHGPRQAGKSTLLRHLAHRHVGVLRDLDDAATLGAAIRDPLGMVGNADRPVYIDEVQRAGDPLIRAIKWQVDRGAARGQFVLAGSMRFLSAPSPQESLAGRAGVLEVWPFSQGELERREEHFVNLAFQDPERLRRAPDLGYSRSDYLRILCRGGFPEVALMTSDRARAAWFGGYVRAVTESDIRAMARVRESSAAGTILRALAAMSGQVLVAATLAERSGLSRATVDRYVDLLDAVFLVTRLPSWSRNLLSQAVRAPKVYVVDSGLLCHLVRATPASLSAFNSPAVGPVVETFVVNELLKQVSWSSSPVLLGHYRDSRNRAEVDVILENESGRFVAVEVKAAETVNLADFRHVRLLQAKLGNDFQHGFVVYLGRQTLSFGEGLTALPLGMLWSA